MNTLPITNGFANITVEPLNSLCSICCCCSSPFVISHPPTLTFNVYLCTTAAGLGGGCELVPEIVDKQRLHWERGGKEESKRESNKHFSLLNKRHKVLIQSGQASGILEHSRCRLAGRIRRGV